MGVRRGGVGEEPGRFDDDVDAQVTPGKPLRVTLREDRKLGSIDRDAVAVGAHRPGKSAKDGVVLEEVGKSGGVGEVVDGNDLEL